MGAASVKQASAKAAEEHRKAEAHAAREQELWEQARATGNDASRIASSKVCGARGTAVQAQSICELKRQWGGRCSAVRGFCHGYVSGRTTAS